MAYTPRKDWVNFVTPILADDLDAIEAGLQAAAQVADAAQTLAGQKSTMPAGGYTESELSAAVKAKLVPRAGLRYTFLWNGTAYVGPDGVAATSANSTVAARTTAGYGGTYRDYVAGQTGPDANALGLMIDGDALDGVA